MVDVMPLTPKQLQLLKLWSEGLSLSEIALKLGVSRQAVHKGIQAAEAKVYRILVSAAKASKIEIRSVDAKRGFLVGWSPWLKSEVYITLSVKNGLQIWFKHEADCSSCPLREDCKRILLGEMEERGIRVEGAEDMEPSKLADELFSRLKEAV
ncbi:MAG: hypothetical protein DRJ68_07175 [Thermoprotei archaeon]|nr:MAG: hypothetical protein DRJ68_07175 [Thermoprotei archaeon]